MYYKTILSYCSKRKKYTESIKLRVSRTSNREIMLLEASVLLSQLGIRTPLSKITFCGYFVLIRWFKTTENGWNSKQVFTIAWDKFMS